MNANANRVDIWLAYRWKSYKHSWNLAIYERMRPSKIKKDDYELASKCGNDIDLLKRNNAEFS